MLKFIAFGLAVGAGVQAWRNIPPDGPVSHDMMAVVMVAGVLTAFLGGLWFGRGRGSATATATATATASAEARQSVNVFNVVPGGGARPYGVVVPDESVSWFGSQRPQLDMDQLDGFALEDFVTDQDHTSEHQVERG